MEIGEIRELTDKEIAGSAKLGRPQGAVGQIRSRHHTIAKFLAAGLKLADIAKLVGMTPAGVRAFAENEANAELIATYTAEVQAQVDSFIEARRVLMEQASLKAQVLINEALDEALETGTPIGLDKLVKIAANADDRTGLGKQETRVNLNANVGARLDAIREKRLKGAREVAVVGSTNVVKLERRF